LFDLTNSDREEALREDFHLDGGAYGYDDDNSSWGEDTTWTAEEDDEKETSEKKDESTAYLEFLNDEVKYLLQLPTVEAIRFADRYSN
jgi:hypothetical protein